MAELMDHGQCGIGAIRQGCRTSPDRVRKEEIPANRGAQRGIARVTGVRGIACRTRLGVIGKRDCEACVGDRRVGRFNKLQPDDRRNVIEGATGKCFLRVGKPAVANAMVSAGVIAW